MLLTDGELAGFYVGYNEELRFKQELKPANSVFLEYVYEGNRKSGPSERNFYEARDLISVRVCKGS